LNFQQFQAILGSKSDVRDSKFHQLPPEKKNTYIEGDYMGHVNMDYFTFKIGIYKYVMCLSLYFTSLSEYQYQRILLLRVPQDLLFLG